MDRFRGRVALVTGASSGIGEGIARELCVLQGMKVIGCARRKDRLDNLQKTYAELSAEYCSKGKFYGYKCDLENDEDVKKMFLWIKGHPELGRVDVCVNNAGIWVGENLSEGVPEMWRRLWNLNVVAASLVTQHSVNLMIEKGIKDGQVVFINSLAGHRIMADGYMVMYNSVKLALTCLVDGWRREARRLGNNKIRISQICPGLVESEIIYARDPEKVDYSKKMFENTPHLKPSHIAYAVVTQIAAPSDCLVRDTIVSQVHENW